MSKYFVQGGRKLSGTVRIQGSKNAALPVIAAAILAEGVCEIENVPEIRDVQNFLKILKIMGAEYKFADHHISIDTANLKNRILTSELTSPLRASILAAGPLLARFGFVELAYPGGDAIGRRPIDVHLDGFRRLGAEVLETRTGILLSADKLIGTRIVLGVTSVTGTENLIMAAVRAAGVTEIHLAATEPHVQDLCRFLEQMGARIQGIGTPLLSITGVEKLFGTKFSLCADEIDAITFAAAAAATKGSIIIKGANPETLDAPLYTMERMGVKFNLQGDVIQIQEPDYPYRGGRIITGVYPQLLTDYQPLLGVLATQAEGETAIHDWIYEGRQGYLRALKEMGAKVEFDDVHRSRIYGPTELHGANIKTPDIRAGASILIAALVAKGQSILYNAEIIDRGYERLDERLTALGAAIKRVE